MDVSAEKKEDMLNFIKSTAITLSEEGDSDEENYKNKLNEIRRQNYKLYIWAKRKKDKSTIKKTREIAAQIYALKKTPIYPLIFKKHIAMIIDLCSEEIDDSQLIAFWKKNFEKVTLYHGTSDINLNRIKKYGMVPGMLPWDRSEIQRLNQIFLKAGSNYIQSYFYDYRKFNTKKGALHLTESKEYATQYAINGSEALRKITFSVDQNSKKSFALRMIVMELDTILGNMIGERSIEKKFKDKSLQLLLLEYTKLDMKEVNDLFVIHEKYWNLIKKSKPIVISINAKEIPEFIQKFPLYESFEMFKMDYKEFCKKSRISEENQSSLNNYFKYIEYETKDVMLLKRIPSELIIDIEYV